LAESAFLDANISMFAAGADHPLRMPCASILREVAVRPASVYSSAEVLQEILHVYSRRGMPERARQLIHQLRELLGPQLQPVTPEDVYWCLDNDVPGPLQARDRLHLAVMSRLGIRSIISTDRAFANVPWVRRLAPEDLSEWRESIFGPV
jgi:predicted nucleic acid-binding protein